MRVTLLCTLSLALVSTSCAGGDQQLLLGATTSVQDPGLLDQLVEAFEAEYDYDVKPVVQGSGQVLELAREGEFDVIITHSPADEQALIDDGFATERIPVMQNYFQIVGPTGGEPYADLSDATSMPDAFRRIAEASVRFISRGDESGTHRRELAYWDHAAIDPAGQPWYVESAAGQGQTLFLANDDAAYTVVDSSTFTALRDGIQLVELYRDATSPNVYSVLRLDDDRLGDVNAAARDAWIDFITGPAGQRVIREFGAEEHGEPLFEPLILP
jgi:tungstate transport system substrate-binding protein